MTGRGQDTARRALEPHRELTDDDHWTVFALANPSRGGTRVGSGPMSPAYVPQLRFPSWSTELVNDPPAETILPSVFDQRTVPAVAQAVAGDSV